MSKPIKEVTITTLDEKTSQVRAVFDTGSFYTIIREDKIPTGAITIKQTKSLEFKTAAKDGKLSITGGILLTITIDEKMIEDSAFISPDLSQEMIIGAGTMQKWDITIQNFNGETKIIVKYDMRDPDIIEVD